MNRRHFTLSAAAGLLAPSFSAPAQPAANAMQGPASAMDMAMASIRNADSVQAALTAWALVVQKALPHLQMTALVSKVAPDGKSQAVGDVRRIFSTIPSAYPVGGWKHLSGSDWSRHVLERQQVLVASGNEALAKYFPDHELLRSLGTRTLVNIPVVVCRKTVGAFAFLCAQEAIAQDVTAAIDRLASVAAPVFLLPGVADA